MSLEIEETLASVTSRTVPRSWLKAGFLSQTSLEGYIDRLKRRVDFYAKWLEEGLEGLGNSFWLPGFFQVMPASDWSTLLILPSHWSAPLLHLGPQAELRPGQRLLCGRGRVCVLCPRPRGRCGGRGLWDTGAGPGGSQVGRGGGGPGRESAQGE